MKNHLSSNVEMTENPTRQNCRTTLGLVEQDKDSDGASIGISQLTRMDDISSSMTTRTTTSPHRHPDDELDLSMLQAATLLTADCMGTGLLALPQDIQVLGGPFGFFAIVVNLPIAWYAGFLLSQTALRVEGKRHVDDAADRSAVEDADDEDEGIPKSDGLVRVVSTGQKSKSAAYSSVGKADENESSTTNIPDDRKPQHEHGHDMDDSSTHDYTGLTQEACPSFMFHLLCLHNAKRSAHCFPIICLE
jgi:hypothetical protein